MIAKPSERLTLYPWGKGGTRLLEQSLDANCAVDPTHLKRCKQILAPGYYKFMTEAYLAFGRLAPYLERDCLRSFTPCKSSDPRTMW
jgi:hypothetical protein